MVNAEKRFFPEIRKCFGRGGADEKGGDEAGTVSNGNGVDIVRGEVRCGKSFLQDRGEIFFVFARGKIGHDAAKGCVEGDLRRNGIGENMYSIVFIARDNGCRRFVAGCFDSQNAYRLRHREFTGE